MNLFKSKKEIEKGKGKDVVLNHNFRKYTNSKGITIYVDEIFTTIYNSEYKKIFNGNSNNTVDTFNIFGDFILYKNFIFDFNITTIFTGVDTIDSIDEYKYDIFVVNERYSNNTYVLDLNMNIIVYDVKLFINDEYLIFNTYEQFTLFDIKNRKNIISFDDYDSINNDRFIIKDFSGKYGIIKSNGDFIVNCIYDDINVIQNKLTFTINNKYGLMDFDGVIIISPSFDKIIFDKGNYLVYNVIKL